MSDTTLPTSEQDKALAGSFEARPGATDIEPTGVSGTSTTNSQILPDSVKGSLDSVAQQVPSTETITEKLPTAQEAADTVKAGAETVAAGAASLIAGISNLAFGAAKPIKDNAESHNEAEKVNDVEELHVPGAFEDATSDRDDLKAVQGGLQSAYNTLPSTEQVKETIPGVQSGVPITQQARETAQTVQDQAQRGTQYVQDQLPTGQTGTSSGTIAEQAQLGARSVQEQARQGVDYVKQQLPGQQTSGVDSQTGVDNSQIHKDGTDYIKNTLANKAAISSVNTNSTTNELAGQVPLEPRGIPSIVADSHRQAGGAGPLDEPALQPTGAVPDVVAESQREAGQPPEASANPVAVLEKKEMEQQLQRQVPEQGSSDIGNAVSSAAETAAASAYAAAANLRQKTTELTGTDPASVLPQSTTRGSSTAQGSNEGTGVAAALSSAAATAATAAANAAQAVREKATESTGTDPVSVLPQSAQRSVDQTLANNTTTTAPSEARSLQPESTQGRSAQGSNEGTGVAGAVSSGAASVGTAAATAGQYLREKTTDLTGTDPVSVLPQSAQGNNGSTNISGALSSGAASAGTAVADGAQYAREKTTETTGTDPVSVLPQSAQRSVDQTLANNTTGTASSEARPLHAGAASGIPRDTVESSAAPDVSYEHRPKTLPQSEIVERERQRGLGEGTNQPAQGTLTADSSHEPSLSSGVDLASGVKNGVVGAGSGRPLDTPQHGDSSLLERDVHKENSVPLPVDGHLPAMTDVDLSSGVKNGVTGSGSGRGL